MTAAHGLLTSAFFFLFGFVLFFTFLTESYLIFYHFVLAHLPASQVAGAIDPLWLIQRNY